MKLIELYNAMSKQFGPQNWWPVADEGSTTPTYEQRKRLTEGQKLEVCLGAILAQNTGWRNAAEALEALHREKMIGCKKIVDAGQEKLAVLLKPSGYYNQKAKKLKAFCSHVGKNYSGSLGKMLSKPLRELRAELLSLHGIGNETADDILLYAAGKPSFVVDAYTVRFLERFFGKKDLNYVEAKAFFEQQLPADTELFNEFHALLVEHGKRYCAKSSPKCGQCFLRASCNLCAKT